MMRNAFRLVCLLPLLVVLTGCHPPGKPGPDHVPVRPQQQRDFNALYQQNCQACHGVDGRNGMAISLSNPAFIAYAGADHIAAVTANGIEGSLMPAFATGAGGLLTEEQVHVLANGIVTHWANAASLAGVATPPYENTAVGDPPRGADLYRANCLHCHAPGGDSILSPTYLALISDRGLRTTLVAGKPERGMPDWRGYSGGPLTDAQLSDLVAFLASRRSSAGSQTLSSAVHPEAHSATPIPAGNTP